MSGTAVSRVSTDHPGTVNAELRVQLNQLIDDLELLRGVSGTGATLLGELHDDHATFKAAVDAQEVLIEELHDDHATFKTLVDELKTDYTALLADVTDIRTKFIAVLAKLDDDAGVTDTDYESTQTPAALTATAIAASSPATLTAPKPPSGPATLTASKPTVTDIEAADLLAAKINKR